MAKSTPPVIPEVHVVFDTNALFTDSVDWLFSLEVSNFIKVDAAGLGISTFFYVPAMVVAERKRQMLSKAKSLLPSVEKIERLLGRTTEIAQDTLELHVGQAIQRQLDEHGAVELELDVSQVDWARVIRCAAERLPPFSEGGKEKGFRDAVILETFIQLVESKPRSSKACRLFLVTGDELMSNAAVERLGDRKNASAVMGTDPVLTELNAIAAHIDPTYLARLIPKLYKLFFDFDKQEGLFSKWNIRGHAGTAYTHEMNGDLPVGFVPKLGTGTIFTPTFLGKEGQKLSLSNRVEFEATATKMVFGDTANEPGGISAKQKSLFDAPNYDRGFGGILSALGPVSEMKMEGRHAFEVVWHVTLNKTGKLQGPALEYVRHVSSEWGQVS